MTRKFLGESKFFVFPHCEEWITTFYIHIFWQLTCIFWIFIMAYLIHQLSTRKHLTPETERLQKTCFRSTKFTKFFHKCWGKCEKKSKFLFPTHTTLIFILNFWIKTENFVYLKTQFVIIYMCERSDLRHTFIFFYVGLLKNALLFVSFHEEIINENYYIRKKFHSK